MAVAIVDEADHKRLSRFRWSLSHYGYAQRNVTSQGTRTISYMHREVLGLESGDPFGDHRNGIRTDNRRSNLRPVNRSQHNHNQLPRGGSSLHRGVSLRSDTNRWTAYVGHHGQKIALGCYDTEEEAAGVARRMRDDLWGGDEGDPYVAEIGGVPPSLNRISSRGSRWAYSKAKKEWQRDIGLALMACGLPRDRVSLRTMAVLRFPTAHRRDAGNFGWLLEKCLGDALVEGGWLPDDTPDFFRFEGVAFAPTRGKPLSLISLRETK